MDLHQKSRAELQILLAQHESEVQNLQAQLDAMAPDAPQRPAIEALLLVAQESAEQVEDELTVDDMVNSLEDVALLIEHYYNNTPYEKDPADAYNIAGFERAHIRTPFGWHFKNLPKPTLAQLLLIEL